MYKDIENEILKQYEDIALTQLEQQNEISENEFKVLKSKKLAQALNEAKTKRGRKPLPPEQKKSKNNEVRLSFRLYDKNDILKFKIFQKQVDAKGQSLSNALADIVMSHLDEKDKRKIMSSLKVDLFYAFRKAFFASLSPYTANIINQVLKVRVENNIINKKLDLLLNAFAGGHIDEETINNPGSKMLIEPKYFEQIRQILNIENEEKNLKTNEKVAKVKKREQAYENYEFSNETDPEILAEYFDLDKNEK